MLSNPKSEVHIFCFIHSAERFPKAVVVGEKNSSSSSAHKEISFIYLMGERLIRSIAFSCLSVKFKAIAHSWLA